MSAKAHVGSHMLLLHNANYHYDITVHHRFGTVQQNLLSPALFPEKPVKILMLTVFPVIILVGAWLHRLDVPDVPR